MEELDFRLKSIEQKLSNIEEILLNFTPRKTIPSTPIIQKALPPPPPFIEEPIDKTSHEQIDFTRINSHLQNWPTLLGTLLILLSLGWSFYYVYSHGLLSKSTALIIGLIINISLISWGTYLIPKRKLGGEILINLGTAGGVLSLWFANIHYQLISSHLSLLGMIGILFTTTGIALKRDNKNLGISASFWAMLVPILIGKNYFDYFKLMSYVLVIDCAALLGFFLRGWSSPLLLSCAATYLFQLMQYDIPEISFLATFFFLFYAGWSTLIFSSEEKENSSPIHLVVISIISILTTMFQLILYSYNSKNMASSGLLVLSLTLSFSFYKLTQINADSIVRKILSIILPLCAFLCILSATKIAFTNPLRNLLMFVEIWLAVLLARYAFKAHHCAHYLSLLFILPFFDYFIPPGHHVSSWNMFIAVSSIGSTLWIIGSDKGSQNFSISSFIFYLMDYFFMQCVGQYFLIVFPSEDLAWGITIISFTLIGVLALSFAPTPRLLNGGRVLIIFVALRLIFVEIWEMTLLNRIITFLSVGIMLILTGFTQKKTPKVADI